MARGQSRRHRDHDQQIGRLQKGRLFLCPHQSWRLSIALCSIRRRPVRTPAQRGEGGCPSSRCHCIRHAKRREDQKPTPWRRARKFFRVRKKPNPPFDALRAVWPHFGFLSCGVVRRGDAASAEKTIRSLTRPVFDQQEPAARLSRWPRTGRNPGAPRLWLVALPRDLSPLP